LVNNKLLSPPGVTIRHVPIKIYLPTSASQGTSQTIPEGASEDDATAAAGKVGHIRVVQSLVPLRLPSKSPQTLGTALNGVLPSIFPSRRSLLLAQPVLHGAVVPMGANLEELGRGAGFGDGFLHIAVVMMS
jgi:autophagy-related protein 5